MRQYKGLHHFQVEDGEAQYTQTTLGASLEAAEFSVDFRVRGIGVTVLNRSIACHKIESHDYERTIDYFQRRYGKWFAKNESIAQEYARFFDKNEDATLFVLIDEHLLFNHQAMRLMASSFAIATAAKSLPPEGNVYMSSDENQNEPVTKVGMRALLLLEQNLLTACA